MRIIITIKSERRQLITEWLAVVAILLVAAGGLGILIAGAGSLGLGWSLGAGSVFLSGLYIAALDVRIARWIDGLTGKKILNGIIILAGAILTAASFISFVIFTQEMVVYWWWSILALLGFISGLVIMSKTGKDEDEYES